MNHTHKKKNKIKNQPISHLKTSHSGPDLLRVPHGDNIRLEHLGDED